MVRFQTQNINNDTMITMYTCTKIQDVQYIFYYNLFYVGYATSTSPYNLPLEIFMCNHFCSFKLRIEDGQLKATINWIDLKIIMNHIFFYHH